MYRPYEPTLEDTLLRLVSRQKNQRKMSRVPWLDLHHAEVVGTCLTYEVILRDGDYRRAVQTVFKHIPEGPPTMPVKVGAMKPYKTLTEELEAFRYALSVTWGDLIPFIVQFQAFKLVQNGRLQPNAVQQLLPFLSKLIKEGTSAIRCADALRQLYRDLPERGPLTRCEEFSTKTLVTKLESLVSNPLEEGSTYYAVKKNEHLALIHHVRVTPAGVYLEGPEPEVCQI